MAREFNADDPELMDRPQPVSDELRRDLENLASLNRWFGAYAIVDRFMAPWWEHLPAAPAPAPAPAAGDRDDQNDQGDLGDLGNREDLGEPVADRALTVLDLCTGSGDIPRRLVDQARARGRPIKVWAVDFQPATLEIARQLSAKYPEIEYRRADVLDPAADLPAADLVLCSLALHHFSDADAVRLLQTCRARARRAALVADLQRRRLTTWGVWWLTTTCYRDPMTVADARTSARRAFSFKELSSMLVAAEWAGCEHRRSIFGRQWAVWQAARPPA